MTFNKNLIIGAGLLCVSSQIFASNLTFENLFVAGTPAVADEVNANNLAIEIAVDDNDARLTKMETGSVSVHANGFTRDPSTLSCTESNRFSLYFSAGASCRAQASISIPDKTELTGLTCTAFDNSQNGDLEARLHRTNATTGANQVIYTTNATTSSAVTEQLTDIIPLPSTNVVDNSKYFYKLEVFFGPVNGGSALKFYGCSVSYEL